MRKTLEFDTVMNVRPTPRQIPSPELCPCIYRLLQKAKLPFDGARFHSFKNRNENSWMELKIIPKSAYENGKM